MTVIHVLIVQRATDWGFLYEKDQTNVSNANWVAHREIPLDF